MNFSKGFHGFQFEDNFVINYNIRDKPHAHVIPFMNDPYPALPSIRDGVFIPFITENILVKAFKHARPYRV